MRRRRNAPADLLTLASMRPKPDATSLLSTAELDPSHIMEVGTDMPLRRQDRRGDRAERRTPRGIYPLEPDRWRLLWHIIVTVLLLAALASTAPWLLLGPV
jgi:hypothetical protein